MIDRKLSCTLPIGLDKSGYQVDSFLRGTSNEYPQHVFIEK